MSTRTSTETSRISEAHKIRELLITDDPFEVRASVLENSRPVEFYADRRDHPKVSGNIYKGKVKDILPGMEAAFVDIGLERNAFLYVKELLNGNHDPANNGARIEHLLKRGQELLVQVSREPRGTKGARLTTQITLPGRYLVLVPNSDVEGFSKRLDSEEAARIEPILKKLNVKGAGLIVRTAAFEADESQLKRDLKAVKVMWKDIEKQAENAKAPTLLYSENDFAYRVARDLFTDDFKRMVIDSKDAFRDLQKFFKKVNPELIPKMELYEGTRSLFSKFNVEDAFDSLIKRVVWLRSGGFITFDRTEAMTVIDVNTGKFIGKTNLEETIFKTNLEAADEICKQLRLRDIGGIIIIDFIDMTDPKHRENVLESIKDQLLHDRSKARISEWTEFGLIQITRKSVATPICDILMEKCHCCDGYGRQISLMTLVKKSYRLLESTLAISPNEAFIIGISKEILDVFLADDEVLKRLKKKTGKKVIFVESQELDEDCYVISAGKEKDLRKEVSLLGLNLLN